MSELTVDFAEPYHGGAGGAGAPGQVAPWMVAIDGRRYLLDTKNGQYDRKGIDVLQQRNTNSARDVLLLPQDVWRQQQESWHQGAGQKNLDRDDALNFRFYRSFGVDPWTKYELSLLNKTSKLLELTDDKPTFVQVHNDWLAVISGTTIVWFETPTSSPVTLTGVGTSDVIAMTYDGDAIITLHQGGEVFMTTNSTTTAERTVTPPTGSTPPPNPISEATFVAYAKDYLILGVGNQLWDITSTQATLVYTSPVAGFTWSGACEGNQAVYLIGGVGDKYVVHRLGVKQDGTGLQPAVMAGTLPDGEVGLSIGSYLGYVFIGTRNGVRMGSPAAGADLVLGALLPTRKPVYGFEGQDRFVWVTASEIDSVPSRGATSDFPDRSPVCGLVRADLSTFTVTEFTPAYATDLVADDQSGKTVRSVTTWSEKRVFSVDGGGVYNQSDDLVDAGWLENGRLSFSVEDLKTGLYCQSKWEPLRGSVGIDLSYDSLRPLRVVDWSVRDSIRSGNVSLNGRQFSRVDVTYILRRDAVPTEGPTFTRFELRARPVKGAASRWSLPIINHEEIDLNGIVQARDVTDEFFRLMDLVESGRMFPLQEWGRTYHVVAKDFMWKPERLNLAGTGWQGVYTLVVEEVR